MSSAAQVLANRSNSQLSTGPVSAAGKAASSKNSLRHGLTAKQIVIPGEDPAEYEAYRQGLIQSFNPINDIERALVDELAACDWRLMRARRLETAVFTKIIGDAPDPDLALAEAFLQRPKELDRLLRYMTSIERAYWRAFNKLLQLQRTRIAEETEQLTEIGFVSQFPNEHHSIATPDQSRDREGAPHSPKLAPRQTL